MTGNSSRILAAGPADREPLISVMVLAFAGDPVARWMYRDPQRYLVYWGRFIRAFAGKAFSTGTAWCIDGNLGAAFWLPPGAKPDEDAIAAILDESVPSDVMSGCERHVHRDGGLSSTQSALVSADGRH